MAALAEPLLMTVQQFDLLPERKDVSEELHWGQFVTLSRPEAWHVKLQMKLTELLQPMAAEQGYVVVELPFRAVPEYDVRAADVAVVAKARWDEANEGYLAGAPELVIEILSPSNSKSQIREYAALCLANGCEEFWVVDYRNKTVTVTKKDGHSVRYSGGMDVPSNALGAASISVDLIFE
jgi:Uma2 family endonuclease